MLSPKSWYDPTAHTVSLVVALWSAHVNKQYVLAKISFLEKNQTYEISHTHNSCFSKWISPTGATTEPRNNVCNTGFGVGEGGEGMSCWGTCDNINNKLSVVPQSGGGGRGAGGLIQYVITRNQNTVPYRSRVGLTISKSGAGAVHVYPSLHTRRLPPSGVGRFPGPVRTSNCHGGWLLRRPFLQLPAWALCYREQPGNGHRMPNLPGALQTPE